MDTVARTPHWTDATILHFWQCRICGRDRDFGDVAYHDRDPYPPVDPEVTLRLGYELKFRVVYCTDNPSCVQWATAPGPWKGTRDERHEPQPERQGAPARRRRRGWNGGPQLAF